MSLARTIIEACEKTGHPLDLAQQALIAGCVVGHMMAARGQFVRFINTIEQAQKVPGDDIAESRVMRETDKLLQMLK